MSVTSSIQTFRRATTVFASLPAITAASGISRARLWTSRSHLRYDQTNWFRALSAFTLLAMLWTVYQLRVRALKRRQVLLEQNQTLLVQHQELLERDKELLERHQMEIRALNEQMIQAQEAERMRIAGELHDGVLQQITSLTLRLAKVRNQVPDDTEAKATVTRLQQQLITIGTDIRHLSHELHPALLQEAGLPVALSSYCEEFSKVRGLPVSCETDESVEELSPGSALCIYRIAQEHSATPPSIPQQKRLRFGLHARNGRVSLSCPTTVSAALSASSENREDWG